MTNENHVDCVDRPSKEIKSFSIFQNPYIPSKGRTDLANISLLSKLKHLDRPPLGDKNGPSESLEVCPISGLKVIQNPEWINVKFDEEYGTTAYLIGDRIFVTRPRGYTKYPAILKALDFTREISEQFFPDNVSYIQIEDYEHLRGVSLEARRSFVTDMIKRDQIEALIFCNTDPLFWLIYQLSRRIPFVKKKVRLVKDYRQAVETAIDILDMGDIPISADLTLATDKNFDLKHTGKKLWTDEDIRQYIDELLVFLSTIDWWHNDEIIDEQDKLKHDHPFSPIFDAIMQIKGEIDDLFLQHKKDIETLKIREKELKANNQNLKELNTALKVLLNQRDEHRTEIEERMISNIRVLIDPFIAKLKDSRLEGNQKTMVNIIESYLKDVTSPFTHNLSKRLDAMTPKEIQIANLIKYGKSTKEIAGIMGISKRTVDTHRRNIRTKLGIKKNRMDLRTYLSTMEL